MITGVVTNGLQAKVSLELLNAAGQVSSLEFEVDTGFNDYLVIPPGIIPTLEVSPESEVRLTLGDGRVELCPAYLVTVNWDGQWFRVVAYAMDPFPVIGMRLMLNHDLYVRVRDGGTVRIEPFPTP